MAGATIGFACGVLLAALVSWVVLRQHLRRERAAERRARAAERMAEIGAMTGGLAHEIKNPLSTIGLNAQLLVESISDLELPDAERSRLLNRIGALRREVERLRGILTDFLEYAGQIHLEPRPTDLNVVVDELVDFYIPEAERLGVRIRCERAPVPVVAPIDVKLVKQAVLNLMINATQAMESASKDRARELILRVQPGEREPDGTRYARVHVIDTGPGIEAATLERIFSPYFTTRSGGSGLGLPTARRLVEEHGGRIDVHSEPGRGTEFTIALPAVAPEPE